MVQPSLAGYDDRKKRYNMKDIMIRAARAAGEIHRQYYGADIRSESKGEKGIVTRADQEAEEKILSILRAEYDYGVVAEESGTTQSQSEYYWVIDPLDGTTNYSRRIPYFCVSIALFKKDEAVAAVIYQPITDEFFGAKKGKGSFINGTRLYKTQIHEPALIDCNKGRAKEAKEKYVKILKNLLETYTDTVLFGASALELAYLADDRLDCFITYGDELYDVAAGILIAQEAGCKVSKWNGSPWQPEDEDLLVAPPNFHGKLINYLSGI